MPCPAGLLARPPTHFARTSRRRERCIFSGSQRQRLPAGLAHAVPAHGREDTCQPQTCQQEHATEGKLPPAGSLTRCTPAQSWPCGIVSRGATCAQNHPESPSYTQEGGVALLSGRRTLPTAMPFCFTIKYMYTLTTWMHTHTRRTLTPPGATFRPLVALLFLGNVCSSESKDSSVSLRTAFILPCYSGSWGQ